MDSLRRNSYPGTRLVPDSHRAVARAVTLVAAILVAVLSIVVSGPGEGVLDRWPDRIVIELLGRPRAVVTTLAALGSPPIVGALVLSLVVVFLIRRRWAVATLAAVGPPAAAALTQFVLKPAIDRHLDVGLTFPSGHATGAFAVAAVAVIGLLGAEHPSSKARRVGPLAVVIVAVISGVALVAAQYHFATDVVGGAAVGIGVVTGLALLLDLCAALFRRDRSR